MQVGRQSGAVPGASDCVGQKPDDLIFAAVSRWIASKAARQYQNGLQSRQGVIEAQRITPDVESGQ